MREREGLMKDAGIDKAHFYGSLLETMLDIRTLLAKNVQLLEERRKYGRKEKVQPS